jgi:PKD repeat protein
MEYPRIFRSNICPFIRRYKRNLVLALRYILPLLVVMSCAVATAQKISTKGTDFWLTFMQNSGVPNTYLFFSADSGATVNVYQGTTLLTTLTIPANGNVPYQVMVLSAHQTNSDVVNVKKAIHVTSDKPIALSAFNTELMSTDAAMVLPVPALGDKYYVPCYQHYKMSSSSSGMLDWASQLAVVAHADGTVIEITPKAPVVKAGGGLRPAGIPYTVTLNRGDVYQIQTDIAKDDLTGSLVRVVNSGPGCSSIAVFSGHQRTALPDTSKFSRDHLIEQIPPTRTWGTTFVVPPIAYATKFIVRVLSSEPNTSITFDGTPTTITNAGGFVEYTVAGNKTYTVNADKPILVAQYAMTANDGFDLVRGVGDPFMIVVPPLEQRIDRFVFNSFVPPTSVSTAIQDGWKNNLYVALIGDKTELGNVTIDGLTLTTIQGRAALPVVYSTIDATPQTQCITIRVPEGIHSVDASQGKGVIGVMYGMTTFDSYGFLAGSQFSNLRTSITVRTPPFCPGKPLTFVGSSKDSAEITGWSWFFEHDSSQATGQTTQKTFSKPGTYRVRLIATRNGCITDTAYTTVEIKQAFSITAVVEPNPVCVGQSVRLIASEPVSAGVITYKWSRDSSFASDLRDTNQRIATATHTLPGRYRYRVVATDTSGCPVEALVTVTVIGPPRINAPDTLRLCAGSVARITSSVSDTAAFTLLWSGPKSSRASIISNPALTTIDVELDSAGTYTYTIESTNKYGCKSQKSVTLLAFERPVVTGIDTATRISCLGANDPPIQIGDKLTITGGVAPYRFAWRVKSGDMMSIVGPADTRTISVRPAVTTVYALTVTDSRLPVGCTSEFEITIQLRSVPDANAGPDRLLCVCRDTTGTAIGTNAQCGTPPFQYSWSPKTGLSNPVSSTSARTIANPDVTTQYILTVTDAAQRVSKDTVVVQVERCPSIALNPSYSACTSGPSIVLDPNVLGDTVGMTYEWTPGWMVNDSTIRRPYVVAFDSTAGSVLRFTATSRYGCSSSAATTLQASPGFSVNIQSSSSCETDSVCPSDTVRLRAVAQGGRLPLAYRWTSAPDLGSGWTSSLESLAIKVPRSTQIVVVALDSLGCSSSDTVQICVRNQGTVSAGADTTICASDATMVDLRRGEPAWCGREPIVYSWEPRSACIVPDATKPWNAILKPQGTTTFILRATDDNGRGSTVSDTVVVTVRDSLKLQFDAQVLRVCEREQPSRVGLTVSNGTAPYLHRWLLPNKTVIDSRSDSASNIPASAITSFSASGWLACVTTDANGCSRRDSMFIDIVPRPVVVLTETDSTCLCSERTITANVSGGTAFPDGSYRFSWSESSADAPDGTVSILDTSSLTARVQPRYTTTYAIRIVDANGCTSSMAITLAPPQSGESIVLQAPLLSVDPRSDDAPIEITAVGTSDSVLCKADAIDFSLEYNESLYDPFPTAENGSLLSSRVVTINNDRHRRVRFRVVPTQPILSSTILTRIHGKALVGSPASTVLNIDSVSVHWPCDTVSGSGIDGSLTLDSLCMNPMNARRVLVFNAVTITSVRPNPSSGSFTASVRMQNDLPFDIELISLQGMRIWSTTIDPKLRGSQRIIDIPIEADIAPGAYMLSVRNGETSSFHAVMITH